MRQENRVPGVPGVLGVGEGEGEEEPWDFTCVGGR